MGPVAPLFMGLCVKCPIISAKDEEYAEIYPLCNNNRMNSQDIAEDAKYDRFCLTVGGDTCLRYELITPVDNDWNHLQELSADSFPSWDTHRKNYSKDGDPTNLIKQLVQLILLF